MKKRNTFEVGQPCRHCQTPIIRQIPRDKPRGKRAYYYEYFFRCPKKTCGVVYMPEDGKRFWPEDLNLNGASPSEMKS